MTTAFEDKKLLFIIGSPRSGTTWLQTMIGAHPLVATTVDLNLFNLYISSWIKSWKYEFAAIEERSVYHGLPFLWTEDESHDFIMEFLSKVYERVIARKPQCTHVLDKQPAYGFHVTTINKLLPEARFIHLVRDGRDVAVSIANTKVSMKPWSGSIEKATNLWVLYERAAQDAKQYRGRYIEVKYEELKFAGMETLKRVFEFCDLPIDDREVASIVSAHTFERMKATRQHIDKRHKAPIDHYRKGKVGSWEEEMNSRQRYLFDRIAGDLLRELGYADDDWWVESRFQKLMLPLLFGTSKALKRVAKAAREAGKALLGPRFIDYIKRFK